MTGNYIRIIKFVILLLICLQTIKSKAQPVNYRFYHWNTNNGLSQNDVMCFYKDSRGFMWIGTKSGLNRYDGYKFTEFKTSKSNTNSITSNFINDITEDKQGNLWIGTAFGLTRYNYKTNRFYKYFGNYEDPIKLNSNNITCVLSDKADRLWVISENGGLQQYNYKTDNFTQFAGKNKPISSMDLYKIVEDKNGILWITENSGLLYSFNPFTKKVDYYKFPFKKNILRQINLYIDSKCTHWIYNKEEIFQYNVVQKRMVQVDFSKIKIEGSLSGIQQDMQGNYWLSTYGDGVFIASNSLKTITHLKYNALNTNGLICNMFNSVYIDHDGVVWLGAQTYGFSYYHPDMQKFELYQCNPNQKRSLTGNNVSSIFQDSHQNLWISAGYCLHLFNTKSKTIECKLDLGHGVASLTEDDEKNIWAGSYKYGIDIYNIETGKLSNFKNDPNNSNSLSSNEIWSLYKDKSGTMWVGTIGRGLNRYNSINKSFTRFKIKDRSGSADIIRTIYEDSRNNLWLGTHSGLFLFDRKTGQFKQYTSQVKNPNSLSEDHAQCIFEDSKGYLWIGTLYGLNLFDYNNQVFKTFTVENGLSGNVIYCILEDSQQNLWISTNKGISKVKVNRSVNVNQVTIEAYNYSENDGLPGGEFNCNSGYKSTDGIMYFGSSKGLSVFNPATIEKNKTKSGIAITDLLLFNKNIKVGEEINGRVILKQDISVTPEIVLKYNENVFSLEFSALDYVNADKIIYSYNLEGFNDQWINTNANNRLATFTNLNPGHYIFRVKSLNSNSSRNKKEAILRISVLSPWYLSRWALAAYFVLFIIFLLLLRHFILKRERLNALIKEERLNVQRQNEMNTIKSNFFINVSHEFRTPLTLIMAPIEKMKDKDLPPNEIKNQISLISRNAKRLLNLVNQLLDFRKLEMQQIKLSPSYGDIIIFLKDLGYSFSDLFEKKNIHLSLKSSVNQQNMYFDRDKIEKVMLNLLSNSYKFTPEKGSITIEVNKIISPTPDHFETNQFLEIKVKDTGIGIPSDKLDKIFERYYQVENSNTVHNTGSGIGLALVKEFVELHKGTVQVESEVNKGSVFTVRLPIEQSLLPDIGQDTGVSKDIVTEPVHYLEYHLDEDDDTLSNTQNVHSDLELDEKSILIIEDNTDLRNFMTEMFASEYTIYTAANGKDGYAIAVNKLPDIIVSDIMMPEMDGYELCKQIKTNPTTSHIPVILLTAKNSEESKLLGFSQGADDYIEKPFNSELLTTRINNLIRQRRLLIEKFSKHFHLEPRDVIMGDPDREFLEKAIQTIEEHLSNCNFDIDMLASELAVSRTQLYRKLKALTDYSANQFIRIIRLKRAAQMLNQGRRNITEVMFDTGFNNYTYFKSCFQEYFGKSPKEYKQPSS